MEIYSFDTSFTTISFVTSIFYVSMWLCNSNKVVYSSVVNVDAGNPAAFTKLARVNGCQP